MMFPQSDNSTPSKGDRLFKRLQEKDFRDAYCASFVRTGLAHQIRILREQHGWDQKAFAKHTGRPQSVVSRLENPDYGKYSLQTLLQLASDFDVALTVRFVRHSDFIRANERLSPSDLSVQSFADDLGFWAEQRGTFQADTRQIILRFQRGWPQLNIAAPVIDTAVSETRDYFSTLNLATGEINLPAAEQWSSP